jgi:hypothetical protein
MPTINYTRSTTKMGLVSARKSFAFGTKVKTRDAQALLEEGNTRTLQLRLEAAAAAATRA